MRRKTKDRIASWHRSAAMVVLLLGLFGAGAALAGETVAIFVDDETGHTWNYTTEVVATAGTFSVQFQISSAFVSDYTATATGTISGTTTTTFTDQINKDFRQCAQDETNGAVQG